MNIISKVWNKAKAVGSKIKECGGQAVAIAGVGIGLACGVPHAHAADPTDVAGAVTALNTNIDSVGTTGIKAYMIAGGLALVGVTIAFIKKAKR